jgi:hypothetical protein
MGLTILIIATQLVIIQQLQVSKTERDYERALQMAEAGANAYLNMLTNGTANSTTDPNGLIPPAYTYSSVLTISQFIEEAHNVSSTIIPHTPAPGTRGAYLIYYPAGQTNRGYFAYQTSAVSSTGVVNVVAFGWCNGVVRRVQVSGQSESVFDLAAVYGLDPNMGSSDFAVKFSGSANVVGAFGAEGTIASSNNATYYDGPILWTNESYGSPWNNADPTVRQSSPNVPTGHVGTGTLASPLYRHYTRSLDEITAGAEANMASGSTSGVPYYQANNNNTTGITLLFMNKSTNAYLEVPQPNGNPLIPTSGSSAYSLSWPLRPYQKAALAAVGYARKNYNFVGLRMYPGDYYVSSLTMYNSNPNLNGATDRLYLRTYNDSDLAGGTNPLGLPTKNNPNGPSQSSNRNVRLWIGQPPPFGVALSTTLGQGMLLEYGQFASRFRVYSSNSKGVELKAANTGTTFFNLDLLAYDKDLNGNGYGSVQIDSGAYLYGSLIGWQITMQGGATIQKQSPEPGPNDRVEVGVTTWKELQ